MAEDSKPNVAGDKGPVSEHNEPIQADVLAAEARQAANTENGMTLWQTIKTYPKAIGWSVLLSSTLIMEGYDLALLGNLYASPAFNEKFGTWSDNDQKYQISAAWQSGLSNGARAGEIIGLILAGWVTDRYGAKKTTIGFLVMMIGTIFALFFAPNVRVLVAGEVLCGIPWGAFQSIASQYASEVAPMLRPYLTSYINMCWVFGQLIAAGTNRGSVDYNDARSYQIPFGVQWLWPALVLSGLVFAPESPWWHVRKGNREAARASLLRLTSTNQPCFNPDEAIAMIEHTNEMERRVKEGVTYRDCFRGVDLRRTEIVCVTWMVQVYSGQNLMGYFPYFLEQAGLNDSQSAFSLSIGQYALGLVGTAGSWFLMTRIGRRKIHFGGLCCQFLLLIITGCLSFSGSNASVWAIGTVLIVFTFVYDFTVGPVTYSLVSELSSTRLKAKTIVLARAAYNASNIFVNVMTNYQLSSTAWDWGARTAFFWAGTCLLFIVWVYFRLPEPKDRTYAELDMLFEKRVPARKFATTEVNPFTAEATAGKDGVTNAGDKM